MISISNVEPKNPWKSIKHYFSEWMPTAKVAPQCMGDVHTHGERILYIVFVFIQFPDDSGEIQYVKMFSLAFIYCIKKYNTADMGLCCCRFIFSYVDCVGYSMALRMVRKVFFVYFFLRNAKATKTIDAIMCICARAWYLRECGIKSALLEKVIRFSFNLLFILFFAFLPCKRLHLRWYLLRKWQARNNTE